MTRTGGQILVDHLISYGTRIAYCVPGESFLGALDAFHSRAAEIGLIICRHEAAAANMAEAYGKLTGEPGVCFVTRGPGATHAAIGVHTAQQDSTPMVLFIGQVRRDMIGRDAFQEIDYRVMFGAIAKHVEQVEDTARLPEIVARAFAIANSGRKGPVVVVLPEDVLVARADVADVPRPLAVPAAPSPAAIAALMARLQAAHRPLLIVGGSGWTLAARDNLRRFAERLELPVVAGFRCQDRFDNTHRLYIGELGTSLTPALRARVSDADLLIVVGERLSEMASASYTLVRAPLPTQELIHVHAGTEELNRVHSAALAINAAVEPFFEALAGDRTPIVPQWHDWAASGRAAFEAGLKPRDFGGALDLGAVMKTLRERLAPDAIITNGAGNYTGWVQRHYLFRSFPTQLAPISGAMGYGVPAAIAAKSIHPERQVVCCAGDGCFMMASQDLATAVHYGLNPVFLVFDNGMYGTIRMHQEREYPTRVSGTELTNPDFAAYAQAFGALGLTVRTTDDFAPALEAALASAVPAVIHLVMPQDVISTTATLAEVREAALEREAVEL